MKLDIYKEQVCFHEVGHWVVADHFGFKTGEIRVKIIKEGKKFGHQGSATIFPRTKENSTAAIDLYLKKRIAVLYSGVISQVMSTTHSQYKTASALLKTDGADDDKKIYELLYLFLGVRFPKGEDKDNENINILMEECWEAASEAVQKNEEKIKKLAEIISTKIKNPNTEYIFEEKKLRDWLSIEKT